MHVLQLRSMFPGFLILQSCNHFCTVNTSGHGYRHGHRHGHCHGPQFHSQRGSKRWIWQWRTLADAARCCEMLRCTDRKMNLDEHRWTTIESYRIGHEIFESYNCAYLWLSVHAFWRTVQVQPLGCVRRSGIFNSFPSRSDHPAEVACLQSFSEDAQSLGRFVSLEMRLWSFVCICQVAVKLLQVFPRSFQDWLNGVNLSRNSFIVQDETASVVHGFTTAGTGVRDFNMILLIRKLRVGSAAILGCGSS